MKHVLLELVLLLVSSSLNDAQQFILLKFVKPAEFYPTCMAVLKDIGKNHDDPNVAKAACKKHYGPKGPASEVDKHCEYFAVQMEQATAMGEWKSAEDFCGSMLQFHSYQQKIDLMHYLTKDSQWYVCSDTVASAIDQSPGIAPIPALQANLPVSCKMELEKTFKANGMPFQSATIGCKLFVAKAEQALATGELDPKDGGKQFCDGHALPGTPFAKSDPSPMPAGFPLTKGDWKPQVTLANLRKLIRHVFPTPRAAFKKFDKNGDGVLDDAEWKSMCEALGIPKWDCKLLKADVDKDGDGKVSQEEWENSMGVKLPELVRYILDKYRNAENGWKAADKDGDGKLTQQEFEAHCDSVGVSPENARELFPLVDADGNGTISQEEYKNAFGVSLPELRRRCREKWGPPDDSFPAIDADGNGKITEDEFVQAMGELEIPATTARKLFGKLDTDGNGAISPAEWEAGMGLDKEALRQRVFDKLGSPKDAFKAADKDGDGQLSKKEALKALEAAGMSPEEAEKAFKAMDKDGDGKLSPKEWLAGTGGADLAKKRYGPAEPVGTTIPDFKKLAKAKFGSPKEMFKAMDKDGDGKVSPKEFEKMCKELGIPPEEAGPLFQKFDKNGDGAIDPEEFYDQCGSEDQFRCTLPQFRKRLKKKFTKPKDGFAAFDLNRDGKLSPEEFRKGCATLDPPITPIEAKALFKELDENGDGAIAPEEFYENLGGPDKWGLSLPEFKERAKKSFGTPQAAFRALDANGDGKLTKAEFIEGCKQMKPPLDPEESGPLFEQMDKNGDGFVTPEEFFDQVGADKFATEGVDMPELKTRLKNKFGNPKEALKAMDANGDGKVSEDEFVKALGKLKPPVSPAEAKKLFKEMDKNGDGEVSPEEFYGACGSPQEFAPAPGEPGYAPPREAKEKPVSQGDLRDALGSAFKNGKEAFKAFDADGDGKISPEEFKKRCADLGIPPGEADKLFKELDKNGDGTISEDEFQNFHGVDPEEVKDRFLDEFGNADAALKAADLNGDGKVSEEELKKVMMDKLGMTPENAEKAAKEMMQRLDPDGDGQIEGKDFKKDIQATAEDLSERIQDKLGSAADAMKKWDTDGDGKISKEEFLKGAKEMGISAEAAEEMWKQAPKGADGKMDAEDFMKAFGIGPDELMERCFEAFGNPQKAFEQMDLNHDGLMSKEEFSAFASRLKLKPSQIDKLFGEMDTNKKEHTQGYASKWEFYTYLDYSEPALGYTWGDGFGDIDPWGRDHKKFNVLPHHPEKVPGTTSLHSNGAQPHKGTKGSLDDVAIAWEEGFKTDDDVPQGTQKHAFLVRAVHLPSQRVSPWMAKRRKSLRIRALLATTRN